MATIDPITGLPSSNVQKVYAGDKPILSAPAPVIDATKIGTTTVTPVPTAPAPKDFSSNVAQIANYTGSSAETATSQEEQRLQAEADAQKARAQSQMTDYAQAQSALGGKAGDLATAYGTKDETGQSVNTLAAQLRQLNAQAQAIQLDTLAKGQAEINKATGQNITQAAVARNTADVTRENLINMATIGIKSAIAKADYDTAKSYADQIVEAKYSGMEADLASKKTQLEWAMQQDLAPAQKKLADAQARQIEAKKKEVEDKKAQEKQARDMLIAASPYAPSSITSKAQAILDKGGSALEVAIALGKYGGDYMGDLVKQSTIAKNKADIAQSMASYEKTMKEIKNIGQAPQINAPAGTNANFIQNLAASAVNKESLSQSERTAVAKNLTVLDQLDALQQNIAKQNKTGFIKGNVNNLMAAIGQNADVGTINAQLQAIVPNLARGVYGEVGVLTDNDIANYRKTLPLLTMPKDQNDAILALTLMVVQKNLKNTLETAANSKMDVSRFAPQYQQVTNQINEINDRIGVNRQKVLDYGRTNPQAQQMITDLSQSGMPSSQILQVLGVEN